MTYTDAQKTRRLELENMQRPLTDAERLLLAALNDLRDADLSGDNIKGCEETVKQAEKAVKLEDKGEAFLRKEAVTIKGEEIVPAGHAAKTILDTIATE